MAAERLMGGYYSYYIDGAHIRSEVREHRAPSRRRQTCVERGGAHVGGVCPLLVGAWVCVATAVAIIQAPASRASALHLPPH